MTVEILTPDKKLFSGESIAVTVPGTSGSFTVLKGHAPIVSTLEPGSIIVKSDRDQTFQISGGVIEVLEDSVIILAQN